MTWTAYFGFDFAEIGSFSLAFTDSGGSHTATISSGRYALQAISAAADPYSALATAIQTAMNAISSDYTVSFSTTTLAFSITHVGDFTLDSGTTTVARTILGTGSSFPLSSSANGAISPTFPNRPYYVIRSAEGAASFGGEIESEVPDGVSVGAADDGDTTSVSRATLQVVSDFTLQFEPEAACDERAASATVPWTWQHAFKHARAEHSFLVIDGVYNTVHKLREDGAHWKLPLAVPDWSAYRHVTLRTYVEGRQ